MTRSGWYKRNKYFSLLIVLIPLLVDDPLWVNLLNLLSWKSQVLIPLLVDDPLWVDNFERQAEAAAVLIPLLVDDPLWEE